MRYRFEDIIDLGLYLATGFGLLLIIYYGFKYIISKFTKDRINAYVLSYLAFRVLGITIIDSINYGTIDKGFITILIYVCTSFGSARLVKKYRSNAISVSRFFLGFYISYKQNYSLSLDIENNNLMNLAIGLLFSQITLLTPLIIIAFLDFKRFCSHIIFQILLT